MNWSKDIDPNSPQFRIAAEVSSPMRVMAGPGTGKTFTLQRRVTRLLEAGCNPQRILAVTFTRVAAQDLYREMQALRVGGCEKVRACTLHSVCMELLSRADVFNATGRIPRPLNDYEIDPLLYDLDTGEFGDKRRRRKRIREFEAAWARQQIDEAGAAREDVDIAFESQLIAWLRFHKAMLIGELVPVLLQYLQRNPLSPERKLFDNVLVDEYQDLNKAEQLIIDELSSRGELSIIGDDDQSIYSFKYAHPTGIREFDRSHQGTVTYGLDLCYRCPTRVVEMANSLIQRNVARMRPPRKIIPCPSNGAGDVEMLQFESVYAEAEYVAKEIHEKISSGTVYPGQVLVLTPRRLIGARIRQALEGYRVPVMSCFQEQELESDFAQERMTILKLAVDRYDRIALRWALGSKSQDFLRNQYAALRAYSEEHTMEPWDVLEKVCSGEVQIKRITNLCKRFQEIKHDIEAISGVPLADFVAEWLPNANEDVHDLRAMAEFAVMNKQASDLKELSSVLVELITQPIIPDEVNQVRIMSLHKSKGLSGHMIVVAGCVDGLLPRTPDEDMDPSEIQQHFEEQRRLFYVAITRTKAPRDGREGVLRLTNAIKMPMADAKRTGAKIASYHGKEVSVRSSPFLSELGPLAPRARAIADDGPLW